MRRSAAVFAIIIGLAPLVASSEPGPDPHRQPLVDGCQRSGLFRVALVVPEWVFVNRSSVLAARLQANQVAGRRTIQAVVADVGPAGDDNPVTHDFMDMHVDVVPDPAFRGALQQGGNVMATELEDNLVPEWAWPQVGDHVKESGNWIWDCGHWTDGSADDTHGFSQQVPYDPEETAKDLSKPGAIDGEGTELHPLYELATYRKDAAGLLRGKPSILSRLDVWIQGDGGWANAAEECSLFGIPPAASHVCSRFRDVGGTYSYTLSLGRRPPGGRLVVNPVIVHPESKERARVTLIPDEHAGKVHVRFTLPHGSAQRFGITVEAGWTRERVAPVHYRLRFDSLHVQRSLDGFLQTGGSDPSTQPFPINGPEPTAPPGEWDLFAQASGHWQQISGVTQVNDNETIGAKALRTSFDFWLPRGVPPRLLVAGRECDNPLIDCVDDVYGAHPSTVPFHEAGFNDHPGRIHESGTIGRDIPGPGTYTWRPRANLSHSVNESDSDFTCGPQSCYQLTFTLSIVD